MNKRLFSQSLLGLVIFLFAANIHALEVATVLKVIDGVTLKVKYAGKKEIVRLIGVNLPNTDENEDYYENKSSKYIRLIKKREKKAKLFTRKLVQKKDLIGLEFDVLRKDKNERLLAYVYLADGKMLNEELIREGYGSVIQKTPNKKYHDRLMNAFYWARKERKGFWK